MDILAFISIKIYLIFPSGSHTYIHSIPECSVDLPDPHT